MMALETKRHKTHFLSVIDRLPAWAELSVHALTEAGVEMLAHVLEELRGGKGDTQRNALMWNVLRLGQEGRS